MGENAGILNENPAAFEAMAEIGTALNVDFLMQTSLYKQMLSCLVVKALMVF